MTLILCLAYGLWFPSDTPFLIVANPDMAIESISMKQLRNLYLARVDHIGRQHLTPLQLDRSSALQAEFERWLFGERFNVDAYWYEREIQGRNRLPKVVDDQAFLMVFVARNPGYIGFVPTRLRGQAERLGLRILELR